MLDSTALTKIQSIILILVIVVAAVSGAVYVLWDGPSQSSDTIKIGYLDNLDGVNGKAGLQAAILAVEEINAEGGILGRQVELFGEDDDGGADAILLTNALTKLITVHGVDFVLGSASERDAIVIQDIIAQHKIIYISGGSATDEMMQRVLDNYEQCKYFFSNCFNETSTKLGITDSLQYIREVTGFNKIGYLTEDLGWTKRIREGLDVFLPENGFELVYKGVSAYGTVDFSSYFAAAESAGVEVLVPLFASEDGIPFTKEYYDRQSPMFVFAGSILLVSDPDGWEWTDGKCNHMCLADWPTTAGYPLTSKTLQTRDAYMNRWDDAIPWRGAVIYDTIKFILKDAIERAGTIETEAVINALEETSVETSNARNYVFTESHVTMMGKNPNDPNADYPIVLVFQWQDGQQVPVFPKKIMEEAGATITFPDWHGPWDDLD